MEERPGAEAERTKPLDRETEILLCIMKGQSNQHISHKLGITETAMKVHLEEILRKIHASNRPQGAV